MPKSLQLFCLRPWCRASGFTGSQGQSPGHPWSSNSLIPWACSSLRTSVFAVLCGWTALSPEIHTTCPFTVFGYVLGYQPGSSGPCPYSHYHTLICAAPAPSAFCIISLWHLESTGYVFIYFMPLLLNVSCWIVWAQPLFSTVLPSVSGLTAVW